MKKGIIAAVVVVVLAIGGFALAHSKSSDKNDATNTADTSSNKAADTSTNNTTANTDTTTNTDSSASTTPTTGTDFTINANDESADKETINVKKGDTIKITFHVTQNETYHGGLEFKSDVVNSAGIKTGDSGTVTFTADRSFDFTPYWYQSDIKKDYVISVKVQS